MRRKPGPGKGGYQLDRVGLAGGDDRADDLAATKFPADREAGDRLRRTEHHRAPLLYEPVEQGGSLRAKGGRVESEERSTVTRPQGTRRSGA